MHLLEEMNVQKYLVLKKENEEGPEIKGGHMDALIIHATKVEKISENGKPMKFKLTKIATIIVLWKFVRSLKRMNW